MIFHLTSARVSLPALLCLLLFAPSLFGAPRVNITPAPSWIVPVTPAGKPALPKEVSGGYYISFSDYQVNLDEQSDYTRFTRQIISESGIQNGSDITVAFDPTYEKLEFHQVTIWRDGKSISQLQLAEIKLMPLETDRQRFIYNGYYTASIILKDIRKGDRIEVAYSRKGWNPVFKGKYSDFFHFDSFDYTQYQHVAIVADSKRALIFKDFNKPPVRKVAVRNGQNVYEWEATNVKAITYDDYVPEWYNKTPFVQVTEFKTWKEVVDWGLGFYGETKLAGAIKSKVTGWKKEGESDAEFIGKVVRFVQDEIRYLGVESGLNSHQPHSPEQVFRQRYGDCKDKAFLLCAILLDQGIECDPMLVNTYKRSHLPEYLPSPIDFNHVVVRIQEHAGIPGRPETKVFRFVDPTIALQGGSLSTMSFPPYGRGLLLRKGQIQPISIPLQGTGNISVTEDIFLPLRGDTSAQGQFQVKTVYFESLADEIRSTFQQNITSKTEEAYLNYYREVYKHTELDLADTLTYYDQRDANNFSLLENYTMRNAWQYDSATGREYFHAPGQLLYDQLRILPKKSRKDPVALQYPYHNTYKIRVHMPEYWSIKKEAWRIERAAYTVSFSSDYIPKEAVWELSYEYRILQDHVAVENIAEFRKDMSRLAENLDMELRAPILNSSSGSSTNWAALLLSLLTAAGCAVLFRRLYRYSPLNGQISEPALPFGSWILLTGVQIVIFPFVTFINLTFTGGVLYFTTAGWNVMTGHSALMESLYKASLVFEIVVSTIIFCFSIFLAVLYFKKRDSFPQLFSFFLIGNVVFAIIGVIEARTVYAEIAGFEADIVYKQIVRTLISAAIWVPYYYQSKQVAETFVNTYPPAVQAEYAYEESQDESESDSGEMRHDEA
ncbi:DUF3857 domain-containing protein [Dyadobacter sp. Leaf189]|uniref:DUF3857 domain-containing protein n=1 Tax=Dyadobacter sp. Leaf189 TaxID=1736295 RepID=UPI0006FF68EC|nr:DUF3857 domain-containing protein [Dyadobacter sp. Leaf189]KQS34093.1 hypothetical protein ASG33_08750 [Dyadobacter sp. Leaf189]